MKNLLGFLREVYFFKGLKDQELAALQKVCHEENHDAGDLIFEEGSLPDRFYIVADGTVEVWKDYHLSDSDLLAVHTKGHLFGEMALIDDLPRSATVIAKAPTRLYFINRDDFQRIIRDNSGIAVSIIKSVSSMVRQSNESFMEGLRARNRELVKANQALKEAQEELLRQERLSNLGKFSSLILHDIRNPISVMRGLAEMILLHTDNLERIERNAKKIIQESDRLNGLASELLDYSRGDIRLNMSIVDLNDFFTKVREAVQARFNTRSISTHIEVAYPGPVIMDNQRLFRVFLNLADNARKAMPRGGRFSIKAAKTDQCLKIEVSDTGVGMSREVQNKIFEPFFSSSDEGGTGLGMSIVKSIVEAHKGTLNVSSERHGGTTFTIMLPLFD